MTDGSDHAAAPALVRAGGEIDLDTAPGVGRELARALAAHPEVVLDLSAVTFMDCAGLRVLLGARALADRNGARLALRGVGPPVARLLELTGLDDSLAPRPAARVPVVCAARPAAGPPGAGPDT
ncbi:STAS domain-containing protein [Kitasatospora phosalacinea]|uniref:STAS domain-containing protein n=1 Tax=Kitasatospora phosalacinea TaxID=2065 RepID=UPI000524559F|nr:STAS domain-containing protein [Kitasatospora phosalacinea]